MSNSFDKGNYSEHTGNPPDYSSYQPPIPSNLPPYDQYGTPPSAPRAPYPTKPRGCAQGCLTVLVIAVLIIAGLVWYAYSWFKKNFYEKEPLVFTKVELTQEQKKALALKLTVVKKAFDENKGDEVKLSLSQDELNWLIQNPNAGAELKLEPESVNETTNSPDNWRGYFEFPAEDIISFKVSVASKEKFENGAPYLNIQGTSHMIVEEGKIKLKVTEVKVSKFQFPNSMLEGINEGISEELQSNAQMLWIWDRLRSLKIEKGMVHLVLRALKLPAQRKKTVK